MQSLEPAQLLIRTLSVTRPRMSFEGVHFFLSELKNGVRTQSSYPTWNFYRVRQEPADCPANPHLPPRCKGLASNRHQLWDVSTLLSCHSVSKGPTHSPNQWNSKQTSKKPSGSYLFVELVQKAESVIGEPCGRDGISPLLKYGVWDLIPLLERRKPTLNLKDCWANQWVCCLE